MLVANFVVLGASAVAGLAIFISGRFLVATAHEIGNPDLDQKARKFIGYWAVAVVVLILSVATFVTIIVHSDQPTPSQLDEEPVRNEGSPISGIRDW